jgi:hypothetical protein
MKNFFNSPEAKNKTSAEWKTTTTFMLDAVHKILEKMKASAHTLFFSYFIPFPADFRIDGYAFSLSVL